uniref:Golgin B1 n=1 Tax=Labrus bergylta TaxID=56723 RepID=A0A3Q3G2U9_9LABR
FTCLMKRKNSSNRHTPHLNDMSLLGTHPLISFSLSAQILTAQFRQMEQELSEAVRQREEERQQWVEQVSRADAELASLRSSLEALDSTNMEVARQQSELASLREVELVSQEALEKEKMEVSRLESELALMKEAELERRCASERDREEIVRLESELSSMKEAGDHTREDASEKEKSEVDKLERELASLKEEHHDALKKSEVLAEIWRHLRSLAGGDVQAEEESTISADLSLFLNTVKSIETQLTRLKAEHSESEEHCAELTHTMQTLQGEKMFLFLFSMLKCHQELKSAREELDKQSQESSSGLEKCSVEIQLLEEQIEILTADKKSKEEKIQALQTDLDMVQQAFTEQEGQVRMLNAQLEDRELLSSELEKKLQEMENSMLEYSQTSELNNDTLSKKDSEISELHLQLSQKEQEMTELNDSMSAKLLQAEEERFQIDGEVNKLKEQIVELENVRDEKQKEGHEESVTDEDGELVSLRKAKGVLETQLTTAKKKLQAALVQRKELLKKVADFEAEAEKRKEQSDTARETSAILRETEQSREREISEMEARLVQLEQALRSKEEACETLEQKLSQHDQVLAETLALNKKLSEEAENPQQASDVSTSETTTLQSQVASLEAECEALHKKVQEAQESRKETIRKAKEKDRHHREQLKQQKEEYTELVERFEAQTGEQEALQTKLRELERERVNIEREDQPRKETKQVAEFLEKPAASDWVQEDWVDFATSETYSSGPQSSEHVQKPEGKSEVFSEQMDESVRALRAEIQTVKMANTELQKQLQETQDILSLKEAEFLEVGKELQALREKERQIDALSEEIIDLREKYHQAETCAETLKAETEAVASADSASSVAALQAEVQDFKQFLDNKNHEILELSQQLSEQNSLIGSMQETVSLKDLLISSLQEELKAEQEKTQRLEVEVPQKQEEEKDSEEKIQQLQRKLQAALISRKEALKGNKTLKEQLASTEKLLKELQQKIESAEKELEKLRAEKVKLIDEVDRTLLENQSLGSSCESLKLAMEGILSEKDAYKKDVELAKEEAARACKEWEEKVQGMKDEYETLLKSYENVSDEAERVRRVLEAARQERQELAAKVRTHEAKRQEAERQAEEAQKEVDTVKDKMRKFAKTKQQKILELEEENERLREMGQLSQTGEKEDNAAQTVVEEVVIAQQSNVIMTKAEPVESHNEDKDEPQTPEETPDNQIVAVEAQDTHLQPTEETEIEEERAESDQAETTEGVQALLEDKMRATEAAVNAEREQWHEQEAKLRAEIASLERDLHETKDKESLQASLETFLQESKEREKSLIVEGTKREAQFKELLKSLETEKDNLEERLMNQLAQLNGSIAGYQQEAADNSEKLEDLKREVERLETERAELEAEAQRERERAQQLKSAQRVKEGSQSRAKQLEELLREKQLEVRQLQKDSIQYQERISELGRETKALQLGHDELKKKLEQSQLETSKIVEDLEKTEADLAGCKSELEEAQKKASEAIAEKTAVENNAKQKEASMKAEAEQTLDSVRFRLGAELKEMELRLEDAYTDREKEEEATLEAREMAEGAGRRAQEMQGRLDESLARLAAFSRCMSSLQDDRDRVLDEAKQWETRFKDSLQGKEAEVREAETRVKELAEQLQKETAFKEELQLSVDRLEKADKDWQLRLEAEERKVTEIQAALDEETEKFQKTAAELEAAQTEVHALKNELESLNQRGRALEEAVGRLQGEVDKARIELREREAEESRLCLNVEQLETDLRSSKALTENLQTELHEKEKREVEMLGEKEQAVTEVFALFITAFHHQHHNHISFLEINLTSQKEARKEADSRAQAEKLRKVQEESISRKAKLDSFTKAMGSLQDDRDRVLNTYKQLEEKHLQVMMEKDGLIQEAAGENNSLKEELRSLMVQRDDLYAEKAHLSAQLHGYRDELNQVLSMKESQQKKLLAAHRERITTLEREKQDLESQLEMVSKARAAEVEAGRVERETPSQAVEVTTASQVIDAPGAEVEKLREQLEAAREQVDALQDTLQRERQEQESKGKELAELQWEGGVMRTESETAQERVAELARDLLVVEQKLLEEKEATAQLKAEKQSFSKAMASLQDSRDEAENKARELSLKMEEMSRAGGQAAQSSPGGSTGEVWGLKNALQSRRGGPGLMRMLRVAFCSRQRTPLLLGLYLLTVHVLLLMCLGGYL